MVTGGSQTSVTHRLNESMALFMWRKTTNFERRFAYWVWSKWLIPKLWSMRPRSGEIRPIIYRHYACESLGLLSFVETHILVTNRNKLTSRWLWQLLHVLFLNTSTSSDSPLNTRIRCFTRAVCLEDVSSFVSLSLLSLKTAGLPLN